MTNNLYKKHRKEYTDKGYIVIPDRYGQKTPAIKAWASYNLANPPQDSDYEKWEDIGHTNISMLLGCKTGVIALDVDTEDTEILDWFTQVLPSSPYEKIGAKGYTRFFRASGIKKETLKVNGKVVIEILGDGQKTTLPPSKHPSGMDYVWTGESITEVTPDQLPILPPNIIDILKSGLYALKGEEIKATMLKNGNTEVTTTGRNSALSTYLGSLIDAGLTIEEVVNKLVDYDKEHHPDNPYFSDLSEQPHSEAYTNALSFYASHMHSINRNRLQENTTYSVPLTPTTISVEEAELGKPEAPQNQEKLKVLESFRPLGVMGELHDTILHNSFIKQPAFAISTSLVMMSTLIGRKITYSNLAPNLYVLNIAASGTGKNAPQEFAKDTLVTYNMTQLLGSGNYVSDASLMADFDVKPVRLDIIDEASGLLGAVTSSSGGYDGKMAEILCELYSCSNTKFTGRSTAEGTKGECYRPNVNLLCSTTHRGFQQSLNQTALEKGLLSRFLYFEGFSDTKGQRVKENKQLSIDAIKALDAWFNYKPENKEGATILKTTKDAGEALDNVFAKFDDRRLEYKDDNIKNPVIARLFQQLCKITMISACSRYFYDSSNLIIEVQDVEYADKLVEYIYKTTLKLINNNLFKNKQEEKARYILSLVEKGITRQDLTLKTLHLSKQDRSSILQDLLDNNLITMRLIKSPEGVSDGYYVSTKKE